MSDLLEKTIKKINNLNISTSKKISFWFKKFINKGEKIALNGKLQIEIEKLKWDLKQLYLKLGRYVSRKNRDHQALDFSHDHNFVILLDEIENQRKYIAERMKNKEQSKQGVITDISSNYNKKNTELNIE